MLCMYDVYYGMVLHDTLNIKRGVGEEKEVS
jgi:hypothetical protein